MLSSFSDGVIALLDIPCGTGAMTGALIGTLTRLREANVLPRTPLTVNVCAGDFSQEALDIFTTVVSDLVGPAASQGILLHWEVVLWDAQRSDQTAHLVDRWFAASNYAREFFVVVSNFSGALGGAGAFEAFAPCLEQILARLYNKPSTVVWIEPGMTRATTRVLDRVAAFLVNRIPWFATILSPSAAASMESRYDIEHPISGQTFSTTVAVHRFDRV